MLLMFTINTGTGTSGANIMLPSYIIKSFSEGSKSCADISRYRDSVFACPGIGGVWRDFG
jgi:hypothetical protein